MNDVSKQQKTQMICDEIVERAASLMQEQVAAPLPMIVDRLFTYAVAQMVIMAGKGAALQCLDNAKALINTGMFDHFEHPERSGLSN